MGEIIQFNNDNSILSLMNDVSLCPALEESKIGVTSYTKLPIDQLATLGFEPLVAAVQHATSSGGSGLYYVNTAGKTMFQMQNSQEFIGALKAASGAVGGGQARMTPLMFEPHALLVAAALANITHKLDEIKVIQQEILDFLVQKEKAELKGNLVFLYDVYKNFKYNWDNQIFKTNNHTLILTIRKESEAKIAFYREQIINKINKKFFIHSNQTVNKQLQAIQDKFKDYELSLYALAFSSFLEIILSENYAKEYLTSISNKLHEYSEKYRDLYSQCYENISTYASTSVQSTVLKGLSKSSIAMGKLIEKIPVVGDTQADETLIATGDKLNSLQKNHHQKQLSQLLKHQSSIIQPFIENIDSINRLSNDPIQIVIDHENLYLGTVE